MNQDTVVNLATQGMTLALEIAGPMLLVGLVVGLAVSLFQAVTQINEQTLSYIPKIVGLAVLIVILGPWMLNQLVEYATNLYTSIPSLIGGSRRRSSPSWSPRSAGTASSPSSSCWRGSRRCSSSPRSS